MTDQQQKIDDGGPAFPTPTYAETSHQGMSTRMWLAGMAMRGFLAAVDSAPQDRSPTLVVKYSLDFADAMIAAERKDQSA